MSTAAAEPVTDPGQAARRPAVLVERRGDVAIVTLDRPEKRNALALDVMIELTQALGDVGASDAVGVVLAANGPVFSAGHNFGDMAGASLGEARHLFEVCAEMMDAVQAMPQPVVARVHALATAAGCQLVASCDLAVAAESAGFAIPGGKGGLFCHTPLVAVARNIGRKRALEMALTGDVISAATAADWGLINRAVPDDRLDEEVDDLLARSTRGSVLSKALGKQAFYAQIGLAPGAAYAHAVEVPSGARTLHISGLNGFEADGVTMPVAFADQAELVWDHLATVLADAGMAYDDLVSLRFYLADPADDPANVAILTRRLGAHRCARTVICAQLLEPTWRIEVEAVAARAEV